MDEHERKVFNQMETDLDNLKRWVSKIDNRLWVLLATTVFTLLGVVAQLIFLLTP